MFAGVQTEVKEKHDIVVVGGGIAGIAAAISAAREGLSVLLIEKQINLGGLATVGLISWYEPLCDGEGKQMIGGVCEELIKLAVNSGFDSLPKSWGGKGNVLPNNTNNRYSTYYSPTLFELALNKYLLDGGVEILLDSRATYPVMEGRFCIGIIVENVSGREFYPAKAVIDATGDATVCYRAGIPCENGNNYLTYIVHDFTEQSATDYVCEHHVLSKFRIWTYAGATLNGNGHPKGLKCFVGVNAKENTEFILIGKKRLMDKYQSWGLEKDKHEIMMIPTMPQLRKIRRICGESTFDGKTQALECDKCIGIIGDFRKSGKHYAIPYSVLYHREFSNILAAGRIISASGEGWEITRVIPVCALTGQAAGIAASLAVKKNSAVAEIEYDKLRKRLIDTKTIFK